MFDTSNRSVLVGSALLVLVFGVVKVASALDPATTTQPASAPAPPANSPESGLRVTITYPELDVTGTPRLLLYYGRRAVESQKVKGNTAVFQATPKEGASLKFRVAVKGVIYIYTHALTPEEIKSRSVTWAVPLDPASHYVTFRVINKATKKPIEGARVVARRRKGTRSASISGDTDAEGLVTLRVGAGREPPVSVGCERLSGGPGLGLIRVISARVLVGKDRVAKKVIEIPVDVPSISLKVKVELKTKAGKRVLTCNDGSILCVPVPSKGNGANYRGQLGGTGGRVALLVDVPPGEYRLQMVSGNQPNKYVTISPECVVVEEGKTKDVNIIVQFTEDYRGHFEGVVVGSKGPLAGADVRLDRIKGGYSRSVKTDKAGAFVFAEVPGGPCRLAVEVKGYRKFTGEVRVPSERLAVRLHRSIQLRVKVKGGGKARCAVFYQDSRGRLRDDSATTGANGVATFTLSREGTYLLWVLTGDGSTAASRLLRVDGDLEVTAALIKTRSVVLNVTGAMRAASGQLVFVGTDRPRIVPGRLFRNIAKVNLLPGIYDIFRRQGKETYVRIASKWVVPDGGGESTIEVPKTLGAPESLHEIFSNMLRSHGVKTVKRVIRKATTQPASTHQ